MHETGYRNQTQRSAFIGATLELTTLYDKYRHKRKIHHPPSVREYFDAVDEGERFRKRILKAILPILRKEIYIVEHSKEAIGVTISKGLTRSANTMSDALLNTWISANPKRTRFVPSDTRPLTDRLRAGYVAEGMEIYEDTYDYIEAVALSQ